VGDLDGVFRRECGPAVAALARWSGDLSVAEDAVQEAFTEALRAWPRDGVPDNPGAWVVSQAVIAALHATAPTFEQTDWDGICEAYDQLLAVNNSPVVRANHAVALGFQDEYTGGLNALDEVADDPRLARSSLVPSFRADLLRRDGRADEALPWYEKALAATGSQPAKAFLRRRIAECGG
jgi:predicted RNA polymerase sigma factor